MSENQFKETTFFLEEGEIDNSFDKIVDELENLRKTAKMWRFHANKFSIRYLESKVEKLEKENEELKRELREYREERE